MLSSSESLINSFFNFSSSLDIQKFFEDRKKFLTEKDTARIRNQHTSKIIKKSEDNYYTSEVLRRIEENLKSSSFSISMSIQLSVIDDFVDAESVIQNFTQFVVIMINITISKFWDTAKKNSQRFIRIIELNFLSQTQFINRDLNVAKCLMMSDKCKSVAEIWIIKQRKFREKNWNVFKEVFLLRFSIRDQSKTVQKTFNRFFKLKQNKRSYYEYFEKIRKIERDLLDIMTFIISNRLIQNLNDEIFRMLIEDITD